jgi:sulfur transfer protein SufE
MHEFVNEQNISRIVDEFQTARTRHTLKKLLLEEENRFGFSPEQLGRIQQRINECKARIDLHEQLVHKARIKGLDVGAAEKRAP